MALGAVTPQIVEATGGTAPSPASSLKMSVTNIGGDSSYPTSGSPLTAAQLGLNVVLFSQAEVVASTGTNCAATGAVYNAATSKLQCFANTGVEVANLVNLSGLTWQIISWGY